MVPARPVLPRTREPMSPTERRSKRRRGVDSWRNARGLLTVKLRGHPEAPDESRGRTLSPGAGGAPPPTHHGPLQRLLGSAYLDHLALRDGWRNRLAGFTQGFNVQSDAFSNELQHLAPRLRHGDAARQIWNVCAVAGLALLNNNQVFHAVAPMNA